MFRILIAAVLVVLAGAAMASDTPAGRVLLTVSGGDAAEAVFDREALEALDWREIETHTSFTEGPQRFAGPTLVSVLAAAGADGAILTATALNDYAVDFPVELAARHGVLLALDHNGTPMRIRDKGPIWIVFPLSQAEAAEAPFDNQMVWQLAKLHVGG